MNNQKQWLPKPGDFVRHKLRPEVKMVIVRHETTQDDGFPCRLLEDGKLKTENFSRVELEPWEEG